MRRRVVIVPFLLLAGVLLARRRRMRAATTTPLAAPPQDAAPVALPEPGARFVSVPWTLVEADPAEARLRISYDDDAHTQLDRVDAQETPTQVFVTVLVRQEPPAGGQAVDTQRHETVVPLSSPLGARELVHTPVDVGAPGGGEPSAPPLYP